MKWTKIEEDLAIENIKIGKTYSEIGILLNRTRKSVKEKLNDLGYVYDNFRTKETECLNCSNTIPIANKFCNQSCAATYNNKLRKTTLFCAHCGCEIKNKNSKKFCSRAHQQEFHRAIRFKQIEMGEYKTVATNIYKKYLLSKFDECCMLCGWNEVNPFTNKIPIELHHIDFNPDNNKPENLQLLCPNCHSLSNNWKGTRKGEGRESRRRVSRREKYNAVR